MKIEFTASYLSLLSVWSLLITLNRKRESACSPGYTGTQSVAQTGPELTEILLPHRLRSFGDVILICGERKEALHLWKRYESHGN